MICEAIFNKSMDLIDKQDLEVYFTLSRKETERLEYKSYQDHPHVQTTKANGDKEKLNCY